MNVHVKIPIKYRDDPIDPDVKSTIFDFSQNNVDQAYNQGQLMADVMDKMADFLDNLPDTSMIIQMSNVDMLHKKQEIINYLRRHDDQLSVTIFNENTVTQSKDGDTQTNENKPHLPDNNQEKDKKMSEEKETTNIENHAVQKQDPNQEKEVTEFQRNYPLFVHVQKHGKHSYDPYDLNHQAPDDNDFVNAIGMSHIKRCQWKDIKKIVKNNIDLVFKNPLGILPVNGSLTNNRRKTIAQNSGLDVEKVQDVESKNLGILESDENGNHQIIGKLVVLILKPLVSEPKTQNQKENEEKQALIDSEANDIRKAISEADDKDEKEQENQSQQEREQTPKMNNDLGNDIFKAFVPEGSNSNNSQSTQNSAQSSSNAFTNSKESSNAQNPFDAMEQSNTQTFQTETSNSNASDANNKELMQAMNDVKNSIIAKIDEVKSDLSTYQKTADHAFTLAAVANDVDTSNLSAQFISWARTQVKDDVTKANAIFMITNEIQKPNPRGFCQELRDPSKFVRAVEYLSKETM